MTRNTPTAPRDADETRTHFRPDNTEGYTPEQLARANAIMDAWAVANGYEPGEDDILDGDYQRECERALRAVED